MIRKLLLSLLTIILSFNCYSQISFEKGYYVDNDDQRINCLIKNIDWRNNPTEFEYKLNENSEPTTVTIKLVKEFGIDKISKYLRSTVNIDTSSENINKLSNERNPIFSERELFLKVLVEGKANLYLYQDESLTRYFLKKDNTSTEQLIYKSYKTSSTKISKNYTFRNQIWNNLKCSNLKLAEVENLDYQKNDLINIFIKYNDCKGEKSINYEEKRKKDLFNLNIRPGLNSSSLSIENSFSSSRNTDFDNEFAFRFGVEAEFIMPFNKNKWSLIIEPTYQYFESEKELTNRTVEVDYKSLELPIGIRHYFFLNENSKIFINGSFVIDFSTDSAIDFSTDRDLEIKSGNNLAFGLGYKYNDRYSLELRYQTGRNVLTNFITWSSNYTTLSIIFGYSLF